jgi:cellobiose transport system substrate-binding protein
VAAGENGLSLEPEVFAMRAPKKAALLTIAALSLIALVGCSTAPSSSSTTASSKEKVTLTMWGFAALDKTLVAKYEKEHPNITIQSKISDYDASHQTLLTALAAGKGPDIGQIAIDYMGEFVDTPGAFVDLKKFGAASLKKDYLNWRWAGGVATNGAVVGIPTDVGGMAIAYRTDLFKAAGLPTDPAAVSALWPTWEAYIATGKKYVAATGKKFVDSGKSIFRASSNQGNLKYVNAKGKPVFESNPVIKNAWKYGTETIADGLSANVATYSAQWNAALAQGGIATLPAPAWMLGSIQQQAPDTKGLWNIATLPGVSGNDGGSFLTIPKNAPHAQQAYDFITWLEAPAQQLTQFKESSDFPATPSLYTNPTLLALKNPFFQDAPVGKIYINSLKAVVGHPVGPKDRIIENEYENGLGRVDSGSQSADASYKQTIAAANADLAG